MDDLIKFIKEKYIEDLVSPIDFHKLVIFMEFVGVLGLTIKINYLGSIWLEIGSIEIKNIFNHESDIWKYVTFFQILLAIILVLAISPIYSRLKSDFFQAFSKIRDLNEYVYKLTSKLRRQLTGNQALDIFLIQHLSKDLSMRRKKLIRLHVWGEIFMSCLVVSVIGVTRKINLIDISFGVLFLFILVFIQWKAYLYYIEKVLPVALPEKILIDSKFNSNNEY